MNDKNCLEIVDENGNTIKYKIIMAFKLEETNKYYVVYTDNTPNENNIINIYAANYDPFDDSKFEKIATEREWQIIESQVKELFPQKKLYLENK